MSLDIRTEVIKDKIGLICIPFFIIAVLFITLYTCCNWYLITQNISVREDTIELWLPFTLPWIPLLIWLRPRIKLLNLKRKKGDLPTLYLIAAGFAIIAPCIIAQMYLSTATGKLTKLHFINEIAKKRPAKFYTVGDYFIDRQSRGVNYTSAVTGKYNSRLDLDIYIVCPIYSSNEMEEPTEIGSVTPPLEDMSKGTGVLKGGATTDTANRGRGDFETGGIEQGVGKQETQADPPPIIDYPAPKAWLCMRYYKQISNRLSDDEKKEEYHEFYRTTLEEFRQKNLRSFTYLSRVPDNTRRDGYLDAIKKVVFMHPVTEPAILEGMDEPYEYRNGHKLLWVFLSFTIGSLVWLAMVIFAPFKEGEPQSYRRNR